MVQNFKKPSVIIKDLQPFHEHVVIAKNFKEKARNKVIKKPNEISAATSSKQLHNAAPTLPVHSPHSPVHPNSYPNVQHNKLSGRYIYNKKPQQKSDNKLFNAKQLAININDFSESERFSPSYSPITCNCIKSPNETITPKERNYFDFSHSSATNKSIKEQTFNVSSSQIYRKYNNHDHLLPIPQSSFEKMSTSDLNLKRIAKKSPLISQQSRFEKANITAYDNSQRLGRLAAHHDNQNKYHYAFAFSKSEQTSPNNIDIKKSTFAYDNNDPRSASSLLYVSSMDPWTKKSEFQPDGLNQYSENADPWIKRSTESQIKSPRLKDKAQNGQIKSFSSAKRELSLDTHKKSNYLQPEVQRHQSLRNGADYVLSAPPSPHFLKTSNDASCIVIRSPNEAIQTKSASFSPARGKNLLNPFGDIAICDDNITRHSFQTQAAAKPDPLRHTEHSNCNLTVNNSKRLQNRHSFSSISEQSKEELQLNIRRLSEQMSQLSLKKIFKFSLSDCNVNNKGDSIQSSDQQTQTTDILAKAQKHGTHDTGNNKGCAKEISKCKESFSPKVSTVLGNTKVYASCQKRNPMQETTC
ncbi:uncharacterized protein LOC133836693 [Drosophila sulfurigaster albostrigata]|uniref:uncharacterized protein LOC133836693 n=1 Tax=Drosophila sulfurigaster albostrigata TaxID=89887 RepID=UPI002D21E790|nr:uncharacterized protein LOC133836693 [Drosophila sulfurigaster albostrigata]